MMKVLLVEDDPEVADALSEGLRQHGWDVAHVADGTSALTPEVTYDIVLLDLNLPDMDGLEVCRQLRATTAVPIIAVTARSDEFDKVVCLRLGADDYVVKPYRLQELLARMAAVMRRLRPARPTAPGAKPPADETARDAKEEVLTRGGLVIDLVRWDVSLGGHRIDLTRKEFELLTLLARFPRRMFSRAQLLESVWGDQWMGNSRTLDAHVYSLRRKLGDPRWIRTMRGVGFRFETLPAQRDGLSCG